MFTVDVKQHCNNNNNNFKKNRHTDMSFFIKKREKLLHCKNFSHFSTNNIGIFEKLTSENLKMVSLIYFIASEINISIKFRYAICYTFKINCKSFEKMHDFPINMQ